jgi:hypothetical protein
MENCPNCGVVEIKSIAAILGRQVIEKILTHLRLDPQPPPGALHAGRDTTSSPETRPLSKRQAIGRRASPQPGWRCAQCPCDMAHRGADPEICAPGRGRLRAVHGRGSADPSGQPHRRLAATPLDAADHLNLSFVAFVRMRSPDAYAAPDRTARKLPSANVR